MKQRDADQIATLQGENRRLQEGGTARQRLSTSKTDSSAGDLAGELHALRQDRERNKALIADIWSVLPDPELRRKIGPVDSHTGKFSEQLASPSVDMDFDALRGLYASVRKDSAIPHRGLEDVLEHVRLLIADGQLLAERISRSSKERELLKSNATRAQRLVEDSSNSLHTYQK
jgi:hypothetical protein